MRLLIVKTSSMGDVVHALPVVADVLGRHPGATIDWLVEASYADLPALHPGVRRVWPLRWRAWRRSLWSAATWGALGALRAGLRRERYDLVLDLQGLLKSAAWARQARGPVAGYDRASAREPFAAALYGRRAAVSRRLHAVTRCRALAAAHLGYALPTTAPDFGLRPPAPAWSPCLAGYAVLIPGASRPAKRWPEASWQVVGRGLHDRGLAPVVLWGTGEERALAGRIAGATGGEVPPFLDVRGAAGLLAQAAVVVGLDTGFTHVAAALGRPVVGLFRDHDPALTGLSGPGPRASLGRPGAPPSPDEVLRALALVGAVPGVGRS